MKERQLMYGGLQTVIAAANDPSQKWPANDPDFMGAKEIDFFFYLSSIGGNPTTAKLEMKFQKAIPSSTATEYGKPFWQDWEDIDVTQRCSGGQAWGGVHGGLVYPRARDHNLAVVHESALEGNLTVGYLLTCRVINPCTKMRVLMIPTFTGGEEGETNNYKVAGVYELER